MVPKKKKREESMSESTSHKGQVGPSKKRGKEWHKERRVNLKSRRQGTGRPWSWSFRRRWDWTEEGEVAGEAWRSVKLDQEGPQ